MTKAEFYDLLPGDRVKIYDHWQDEHGFQASGGDMDMWLGTVMTVFCFSRDGTSVKMLEDDGAWFWDETLIERLVEEPDDLIDLDFSDIDSFLAGFCGVTS